MNKDGNLHLIIKKCEDYPILTALFLAVVTRTTVIMMGFQDFWGDSHHNLIMSKLTLENNWVYSDFKDRHLTWFPAFRYWGACVQWITGTYSLQVMQIANTILGVATVAVGTRFATTYLDKKWALFAGILLAIQPYLIVFSYMNMAEILGALMIISWFLGLQTQNKWMIIGSTFIAVLTRTELMYLVGLTVLYLFMVGEKKRALWTAIGSGLGVLLWFGYSTYTMGNPLGWMLIRIGSTTSSTQFYTEDVNVFVRYVLTPAFVLLQGFPLVVYFIWLKKIKINFREFSIQTLMGFFLLNHLLFFLFAQTTIISYPEARFFVIVLPIATVWFVSLMADQWFRPFVNRRKVIFFLALTLIQLIVPFYRQYSLQPRKEIGWWMKNNITGSSKIWSDLAVPIVESELEIESFISSYYLLDEQRYQDNDAERMAKALKYHGVEYIASYPEIFDYSSFLIPELKNHEIFEWKGITFVPVFVYTPYNMQQATINDYLRFRFEEHTNPASIWKIFY